MRFSFEVTDDEGVVQQCDSSGIKQFQASALRDSSEMASHTFDFCEASEPVQMPNNRTIEGDHLNGIRVRALDAMGQELAVVDIPVTPPGAGKGLDVEITCTGTDCTGTAEHARF